MFEPVLGNHDIRLKVISKLIRPEKELDVERKSFKKFGGNLVELTPHSARPSPSLIRHTVTLVLQTTESSDWLQK